MRTLSHDRDKRRLSKTVRVDFAKFDRFKSIVCQKFDNSVHDGKMNLLFTHPVEYCRIDSTINVVNQFPTRAVSINSSQTATYVDHRVKFSFKFDSYS